MNKYDLYWARFYYEDNSDAKTRPCLILDDNTAAIIGAKITSAPPRDYDWENDYPIRDWKAAGLDHESTVQLARLQEIVPRRYIGHLSDYDIENIEFLLSAESENY